MLGFLKRVSGQRISPGWKQPGLDVVLRSHKRSKHVASLDKSRLEAFVRPLARLAKAPRPVSGRTGGFSKALAFSLALVVTQLALATPTPVGTVIPNTASLTYQIGANPAQTFTTNTVQTTVTSLQTKSTAVLLSYDPTLGGATQVLVGPTSCSVGGGSTFTPLPSPVAPGGGALNVNNPQGLVPAGVYHEGDPVFVEITDKDQNLDPAVRDTVDVTLKVAATGDVEKLRLTETGVNTGVFVGYIQTTDAQPAKPYNCVLSVTDNSEIVVSYKDPNDASDASTAQAPVDPLNYVLDSATGRHIDGATITLMDDATGKPAQVFGYDGVSSYPATVISGKSSKDASGREYPAATGTFRFPLVPPGSYHLKVTAPTGYTAPSAASRSQIEALPGAPYNIAAGSFEKDFALSTTAPMLLDVPLDAGSTLLFVQKVANTETASVGDFVQFTVTVGNTSKTLPVTSIDVLDTLPQGMHYQKGSTVIDGVRAADPSVTADGLQLTFPISKIPANGSATIEYVVQVNAASQMGTVVNKAQAFANGASVSNVGTAEVMVQDDLMSTVNTLVGRVIVDDCDGKKDAPGLANVRVMLETGTYSVTDKDGRFHFQGVTNGTHVVQLDTDTLPPGYEIGDCVHNTRFAGRAYSQFVELHGNTLWRVDFHIHKIAPPTGSVSLQLFQVSDSDGVTQQNSADVRLAGVPVKNLHVMVIPPDQLEYVPGTAALDGSSIPDPDNTGGALLFKLGDQPADWRGVITFKTQSPQRAPAGLLTKAVATFDTAAASSQRTPPVSVPLPAPAIGRSHEVLTIVGFQPGRAQLTEHDLKTMEYLGKLLKDAKNITVDVIGYTDSTPLGNSDKFKDNIELSKARAALVAGYITKHFNLAGVQMTVDGHGDANPCESNATEEGRAKNRRTEIDVGYDAASLAGAPVKSLQAQSDVAKADTKGPDVVGPQADLADALLAPNPPPKDTSKVEDKWFQSDDNSPTWVLPVDGYLPFSPATKVAIRHSPSQHVVLTVNGKPVPAVNFLGTQYNSTKTLGISQWLGVPLSEGDNLIEADIMEGDKVMAHLSRSVHFSGVPVRAEILPDKSVLVADGKTKPVLAFKLYDRWGYPVRLGMTGRYTLEAPYQAYLSVSDLQQQQLMATTPNQPSYQVREDGTAYIVLSPTNSTGQLTLDLPLDTGQVTQLRAWMKPAQRDWILVGIASGTTAFNTIKGHLDTTSGSDPNNDIYQDGRVAFYAKGSIPGQYLLTAAYDSAKQSGQAGVTANGLQQTVDPNQYFMLYGDAAQQNNDAVSASKLYVKIERDQFYALFGDYNSGLTVTELSRYDRPFNGVKSEYNGQNFGYSAFAAKNAQSFIKDEIQGDGTSGLYHLSHQAIILDSETITIETHDRFQPDVIVTSQVLTRYIDYNIDYLGGTIFFKQPVPSRDSSFNPVYIDAQYEVDNGGPEQVTGGGRVAAKFNNGKVEIGSTLISEAAGQDQGQNKLEGADLRVNLTDSTQFRAEVAHTDTVATNTNTGLTLASSGVGLASNTATAPGSGEAYLAEIKTRSASIESDVYVRNESADFGLGEQNLAETAMHKYGADAKYHLTDSWSLVAEAYHEESLTGGGTQAVADAGVQYKKDNDTATAGLRHATQDYTALSALPTAGTAAVQTGSLATSVDGTPIAPGSYSANQVYLGGSTGVLDNKLTLHAETDHNVGSQGNVTNPQYPASTTVGADYKVTSSSTVFVNQQFVDGQAQSYNRMTEVGVRSNPWEQTQIQTSIASQGTEYGPRNFSTMGLTQGWKATDSLTLTVGMDRVSSMTQPKVPVGAPGSTVTGTTTAVSPVYNPNSTPSTGTDTEDFTSMFVGAGYHKETWSFTSRLEALHSDSEKHRGAFAGFYKDLSDGNAFSLSLTAFDDRFDAGSISSSVDARFGLAHRPDASDWTTLNQLDFIYSDQQGQFAVLSTTPQESLNTQQTSVSGVNPLSPVSGASLDQRSAKFVDNLQANYQYNERSQLALYYGAKYVITTFDVGQFKGYTDIMGLEYRYDIKPKWDVGFLVNREHSYSAGVVNRSYGIETGWAFATNMWVSLGYNFSGFYDQDFTATHYTAQGVFVRFRFKFDQDTIKDLAEHASPLK